MNNHQHKAVKELSGPTSTSDVEQKHFVRSRVSKIDKLLFLFTTYRRARRRHHFEAIWAPLWRPLWRRLWKIGFWWKLSVPRERWPGRHRKLLTSEQIISFCFSLRFIKARLTQRWELQFLDTKPCAQVPAGMHETSWLALQTLNVFGFFFSTAGFFLPNQ